VRTFYFSLLARGDNPKVEVRRIVKAEATSEANAERDILLDNAILWNRPGWSISLISVSATHAQSLQNLLEGKPAASNPEGVPA
jgi:hypothetical protein